MMTNEKWPTLTILIEDLGVPKVIEFLNFALPSIIDRYQELKHHLSIGNWERASQIAHKTLGSARLYSSNELEQYLNQIYQKNLTVIANDSFQQAMSEEFERVIFTIKNWLDSQS